MSAKKPAKQATFNIKSKDMPTKVNAKTPKCSWAPKMPASMPRPVSSIPCESID
jgi:hypothetical protein